MDSVVVLGVDGADYKLANLWNCENLLLENSRKLSTYAYSVDRPSTIEVWPTIATGIPIADHGMAIDDRGWDSKSGLQHIVAAVNKAPNPVVKRLRAAKNKMSSQQRGKAYLQDTEHVFSDGRVKNWPGITPAYLWAEMQDYFQLVHNNDVTVDEFYNRSLGNSGELIGWLAALAETQTPIIGAHIHTLDYMGHVYGKNPEELKTAYKAVDSLVGMLADQVDRLVILSDHGMQTTLTDEGDPGVHSFRAIVSSTFSEDLPETIEDVAPWLEQFKDKVNPQTGDTSSTIDAPEEHLRDLGYL